MILFLFIAVGVMFLAAVLALVYAHGLQVALQTEKRTVARQELRLATCHRDADDFAGDLDVLRRQVADRDERIVALAARIDRDSLELERLDGLIAEAAEILEGGDHGEGRS